MENNENQATNVPQEKHCECKKYFLIALMTFLGSFLAFYVLMHQTMTQFYRPFGYDFRKQERNFEKDFMRDLDKFKEFPQKEFKHIKNGLSTIQTVKYDDAYVIVVNLKPFNNDENNIRFNLKGNLITVSGNTVKTKKNSENSYYFTESYEIPEKIDIKGITKEKIGDKYIITLPIDD